MAPTRRPTVWPITTAVLGIAVLIGTLLALAWLGGEPEPRPVANERVGVVDGLCAAAGSAGANNRVEASRLFFDAVDDQLNRLAERAADRDPIAARRLLEATDRVEANLETPQPALEDDLITLVVATRKALRALGDPVPPPCPPEEDR